MAEPASTVRVKPGDTIEARYRVIRALDEGGMGSVFLAEHVLIKRRVAVKLLRAELAEDADVLDRFMNEARAAGTLGHPNIVESTDMGFTRDGLPYIVFEYLEGALLTDEIYRVNGFPFRRALRIARQIASALGAAHAAGVVHRDLKADNVFLTDRDGAADHVKVLDFGISRFLEGEHDGAGQRGELLGTPQFMAPEQIEAPDTVDQRADIYALGLILYEMLTARRPFGNDADPEALFREILTAPPPPLAVTGLPAGFEDALLTRFLAKRADERYQSMKEVEAALDGFADLIRTNSRDSIPILRISDVSLPRVRPPTHQEAAAIVALPPPPRIARRPHPGWLVAAIACLAAGGGSLLVGPTEAPVAPPNVAPLQADADKLAATIDAATRAAELRADGFAQSPQLRAAVETDAATVRDMMGSDFVLERTPGETFELFQRKDSAITPLLVLPDGAPLAIPEPHQPRVMAAGAGLAVVAMSPIRSPNQAGGVAIAVPIDLGPLRPQLSAHASDVRLRGLAAPLTLVPPAPGGAGAGPAAAPTEVPVAVMRELGLSLVLTGVLPQVRAEPVDRLALPRLICWVAGGFLAMLYLANLIRAHRRG